MTLTYIPNGSSKTLTATRVKCIMQKDTCRNAFQTGLFINIWANPCEALVWDMFIRVLISMILGLFGILILTGHYRYISKCNFLFSFSSLKSSIHLTIRTIRISIFISSKNLKLFFCSSKKLNTIKFLKINCSAFFSRMLSIAK